jgi:putative transposase
MTGYRNQPFDKTRGRKSIRLRGYDYSQPGWYFITICINDRTQRFFGDVTKGEMALNEIGEYVRQCWLDITNHFPNAKLDEYIIMPNHVHGIITITHPIVGARSSRPLLLGRDYPAPTQNPTPQNPTPQNPTPQNPTPQNPTPQNPTPQNPATQNPTIKKPTVGSMVAYFKYQLTTRINAKHPAFIQKIWQRGYFDHIIRNRKSLFFIRQYIRNNPMNWERDKNNSHTQEEIDDVIDQNTK